MDQEIFEKTLSNIQETLGEEGSAKIADQLGILKSTQAEALASQKQVAKEIKNLTRDKNDLQKANMRLLQQVPMGEKSNFAPSLEEPKPEVKEVFDIRTVLDENGRFIK